MSKALEYLNSLKAAIADAAKAIAHKEELRCNPPNITYCHSGETCRGRGWLTNGGIGLTIGCTEMQIPLEHIGPLRDFLNENFPKQEDHP